jgi:hypothetical protein
VPGTQNSDGSFNFANEAIWHSGGKLYLTHDALTFGLNSFTVGSIVVTPVQVEGLPTWTGARDSMESRAKPLPEPERGLVNPFSCAN